MQMKTMTDRLMIAAHALLLAGGMFLLNSCGKNAREAGDTDSAADTTAVADTLTKDTVATSVIKYYVTDNGELIDGNAKLWVNADGKKINIGTVTGIFGEESHFNMKIFAQEDFDGDGDLDALVYDANPGSGGGSSWVFIINEGNGKFMKSNKFEECYTNPELTTVDGRKVVDFTKEDLGRKIVVERHGLRNGKAVSLPVPKVKSEKIAAVESFDMGSFEDTNVFYADLNGDGNPEKITTISFHFGRNYNFTLNGTDYEFSTSGMWGQGKLEILQSKTNGMHDLMVTDTDGMRYRYKWDGNTYNE